jgi:hypothetical protein
MPYNRKNEYECFWGVWVSDPEAVEIDEDYSQQGTNIWYWVVRVDERGDAVKWGTVDPLFETLGKARAAAHNANLDMVKYIGKEDRTYEIRKETQVADTIVQKRGTGYGAGAWCPPTLSMEVVDTIVMRNN